MGRHPGLVECYDVTQTGQQSLATKITLFGFGTTLLAALVISGISLDATHRSVRETLERLHPRALDRAAVHVTDWMEHGLRDAETAAAELGQRRRVNRMEALVERFSSLRGLAWLGRDGAFAMRGGDLPASLDGPDLAEIAASPGRGMRSLPLTNGEVGVAVWVPGPGGGLLAFLDDAHLRAELRSDLPHAAAMFLLVDATGRPHVAVGAPDSHPPRRLVPPRAEASPGALRAYSSEGRSMLGATRPLGVGDWQLTVQTPYDQAYAPLLSLMARILALNACVILFSSLLAYRMTARALRPIARLSLAARRMAEGQSNVTLPEACSRDEIGVLTRTLADTMRQLQGGQRKLEAANQELTDRNERLETANEVLNQLSITDGLTKLHNHRFFHDHLTREIKRVSRSGEPLSMLILDIDDFKKLNDRFGHAAGDEILARIAQLLDESVRESDLLARYGGEEFVILASATDFEGARALGEKVRMAISETSFIIDDSLRPLRVTVSVGVAVFAGNRKRFFAEADEALYRAKDAGKDCVVLAD